MKTTRRNANEMSLDTLAAFTTISDGACVEMTSRMLAFVGPRRAFSVRNFIKAAQKKGWSRTAAVAAIDACDMLGEERTALVNGEVKVWA